METTRKRGIFLNQVLIHPEARNEEALPVGSGGRTGLVPMAPGLPRAILEGNWLCQP